MGCCMLQLWSILPFCGLFSAVRYVQPVPAPQPPVQHSIWLLPLYGALDSHPFFPSHVASGCFFLLAAAAGALASVVSAFAEPSSWCVGAALNVTWCAVCASAAPNNWRIEDVPVIAGVV